jgi:cell division septation protein DedD
MGSREDLQDTEITLTTGKLLGIFFGLVLICSVSFALGYVVGHANPGTEKTDIVTSTPATGTPAGKPSATNKAGGDLQPVTSASSSPAPAASTTLLPAVQPQTISPSSPATKPATKPADPTYVPASAPDVKPSTSGTYTVQVAAVSKQEDAQSLVSALQKKQYPVFVANVPGDPLFHVQVGPFSDPKEAEAMRVRLAGEGYDAIVKK